MDIAALSTMMSQQKLLTNVSVAVMSKSLDMVEDTGDSLSKMLEQSVQPNLGQTIDITV